MKSETRTLTTDDGAELCLYRWAPDRWDPDQEEGTRGVVQLLHGLAEHAGRYARLAEALTEAGYLVYAHDHRGHGRSVASEEQLGHFADRDGWFRVMSDVHLVNREIADHHPDLPRVLMGHSMGSFMVQYYLFDHADRLDGAILSGTNVGGGLLVEAGALAARVERRRLGPRGKSPLLAFLSFGSYNKPFAPTRTDFDWLSRDPEEVDKYVADPCCGFEASTQLWVDLLGGVEAIGEPRNVAQVPKELPIYIFAGSLDPVGAQGKGIHKLLGLYRRAGLRRVSHRLYEGGRHEMLNETNREEVTRDLLRWLGDVLPAAPKN